MENNKNKEELQSRREFFKSAAKAALPVIGAVVLANAPAFNAVAAESSVCPCSGTCKGSCHYSCDTGCQSTCIGGCKTNCKGGNYGH